ncbi:MAG: M4 family metallopeptidase, partial [Oceanococcaceae bacterium]
QILNRIDEIHSLQNREIYTPNQDVPPVITEGSALAPADIPLTGDVNSDPVSRLPRAPQDNLYIFAGGTYELYRNLFGREGYDDGALPPEEQVQKSVYLINDACPNAYWNGDSTNYCPGFDADDIVSHEWSHAYTEYTHGLIYQYQSGALNEAYSDIFGEMYDLVNGIEGPLGVTLTEGEYFENGGSRWVLGEDLSEAAAGLLLRDMWDPDNFGANVPVLGIPVLSTPSPGSVITSPNYYCGSGDGGGVHTNSGVPNHAFAMLVDGKEFNGVTIPAIGMTRAAHIYFQAMTHYQIPSTNFAQHADALTQSCQDLLGAPLNDVLGNASPDVITSETCAAVEAAMVATEMRDSPAEKCGYRPLLQPEATVPAVCRAGGEEVVDFVEGFSADGLPEGWTSTDNITGDTQEEGVTWQVTTDLPAPHTGVAAFIPNTFGGTCAPGGDISASFQLDTPAIVLSSADSTLSLNHLMQSEFAYDGGNLKYSLNGGDFAVVPAEAFLFSPHNTTLETGAGDVPDPLGLVSGGNTSPIAGEEAWSGSDEGESSSSWGISRVSTA